MNIHTVIYKKLCDYSTCQNEKIVHATDNEIETTARIEATHTNLYVVVMVPLQ